MFFERITALLPIQIKYLNREQLVRSLEVLVRRNIGSEGLFRDYLLLRLERIIYKFTVDQYRRIVLALADKQYVEDHVLWSQYIYKYVFEVNRQGAPRSFTEDEAKKIWDAYFYLKLKCPTLDCSDVVERLESFLPKGDEELTQKVIE